MVLVIVALATVIALAVGAVGSGIIKLPGGLPGATSPAATGLDCGSLPPPDPAASPLAIDEPNVPSGPVESPPPIDNLATPVTGTLTLGDSSPVQAISVGADGASTTVSASGQPWDGLKIDVPAGAWPGATLQITAQPITSSDFGDLVTPISPLYTISGAEGLAPLPVTLKIPAVIPDDSFAMGFFYDGAGHLEGMPLLAEDGTSVTIATEHFSSFFLSLVKKALLPATIDSGFRPGVDDWQFTNYGSFIARNGHCAGQVLTEAWYYIERRLKEGASPLYGLFDNNGSEKTPSLWQDDSDGYRLASVAHGQYQAYTQSGADTSKLDDFFYSWRGLGFDALQYDAFRYSIAVTGEPQLVSLSDAQNGNGHVMLAYRVARSAIFVADPNYPAAWRLIPFDGTSGKFGTYSSGASAISIAQGEEVSYTNFVYKAKSALVDWSTLAAAWAAFDAGTIGNGVFPDYKLMAYDAEHHVWNEFTDGYTTDRPALYVLVVGPAGVDFTGASAFRGTTQIGSGGGNQHLKYAFFAISLVPGDNDIGFAIYFSQQNWTHTQTNPPPSRQVQDWSYVDFVRRRISLGPAATDTPTPSQVSPTAATPSPPAGIGAWVLTGTEPTQSVNQPDGCYNSQQVTIGGLSATTSGKCTWTGPDVDVYQQSEHSWSAAPPPRLAPGETLQITATASVAGNFLTVNLSGWATTSVRVDLVPGGGPQQGSVSVQTSEGNSVSDASSFEVPAGSEGSGMVIGLEFSGIGGSGVTNYTYEWQGP